MQGAPSVIIVVIFLLSSSLTDANELQSNTSTSKCKLDPHSGMPGMPGVPGIPGTPGAPGRDGFKGEKGSIGKRGSQGSIGIPGKIGPRGPAGSKGEIGTKGSMGAPGNIGPRGPKGSKGENGMGTKGEKGDATNMDPRQRANWKQCAWRGATDTDNGKIKVGSSLVSINFLRSSLNGGLRQKNSSDPISGNIVLLSALILSIVVQAGKSW